jgi:hypothetical protein
LSNFADRYNVSPIKKLAPLFGYGFQQEGKPRSAILGCRSHWHHRTIDTLSTTVLGFKGICNRLCTSHLSVFGNEIPLVWTVFEVELPVNKRDITIPPGLNTKWQSIVDTTTEVINVPVALIMRLVPPHLKVVVSSRSSHSPRPLRSAEQVAGYYGGTVVTTRCKLLVPNALRDESWQGNLASKSGFISYLGIPLLWPDGEVFGTFCALDTIENSYDGLKPKVRSSSPQTTGET